MNNRATLTRTFVRVLATALALAGLGLLAVMAGWLWTWVPEVNESWGMSVVFVVLLATSSLLPLALVRFAVHTAVDLSGERVVMMCRLLAGLLWLGLMSWAGQYWLDIWDPAWDLLVLFAITAVTAIFYVASSHLLTSWSELTATTTLLNAAAIGGLTLLFWLACTIYTVEFLLTAEQFSPLPAIGLLLLPAVVAFVGYKISTTLLLTTA